MCWKYLLIINVKENLLTKRSKQLNKCALAERQHFKVLGYTTLIIIEKVCLLGIHLPGDRWVHPRLSLMKGTAFTAHSSKPTKTSVRPWAGYCYWKVLWRNHLIWHLGLWGSHPAKWPIVPESSISESPKKLGMSIFLTAGWVLFCQLFPCRKFSMLSSFSERLYLTAY